MGPVHQVEFRGAHGSNLTNPARRKCGALKPAARLSALATTTFVVSPREPRPCRGCRCNDLTVFNIGGNKFRLITAIHYNRHKIFIRAVLTHTEYTHGTWKRRK